jgi:hypothetical protein
MKNKIFSILAAFLLMATSSFAYNDGINRNIKSNFSSTFTTATNVSWEKAATYYKASFWMNGKPLNAIFSKDGRIIAVSQNILSTELPNQLRSSLNNNFPDYWITDLFKYTNRDETRYYLTIENGKEKKIMESLGTIEWSLFKQLTK